MTDNTTDDDTRHDLRAALIALVAQGQADEEAFRAALSPEERAQVGTAERWAPKEVIAHLAFWKRRHITRVELAARGETSPDGPQFQQLNDESWPELARLTWEESVARSDAATRDLIAAIEQVPASVFTESEPQPSLSDLLIATTLGNSFGHVAEHRAYYYADHGDPQRATQVQRDAFAAVVAASLGEGQEGAARYNLACYLATHGQPTEALNDLRLALAQRPDLIPWAREDHDLDGLRAEPAFQTLVPPAPADPREDA